MEAAAIATLQNKSLGRLDSYDEVPWHITRSLVAVDRGMAKPLAVASTAKGLDAVELSDVYSKIHEELRIINIWKVSYLPKFY